jgi:hypothetical protein
MTATCWRNWVPTFADRGVSRGRRGGSPKVVNLSFIDRCCYFSFKYLLIYPHKDWVDLVPDSLLLRKFDRARNLTRYLRVCSQERTWCRAVNHCQPLYDSSSLPMATRYAELVRVFNCYPPLTEGSCCDSSLCPSFPQFPSSLSSHTMSYPPFSLVFYTFTRQFFLSVSILLQNMFLCLGFVRKEQEQEHWVTCSLYR